MARQVIEPVETDKTTIITSKILLDRVLLHCRKSGDSQKNFVTRALLNQLEAEGDIEIRSMLEDVEDD